MGIQHMLRREVRSRIKEALRKAHELDTLLGGRRELLLKGSAYWGERKEIEAREEKMLDLIYILAKYPRATVPGLPLWINEYPRVKAIAKWAKKRNIPPDKALALMVRREGARFGDSILTSVADSGKDAGGFALPDGRIELTSRFAREHTYLHEIGHQVAHRRNQSLLWEVDEAFADAVADASHESEGISKYKAKEWEKTYGRFDRRRYEFALRLFKWMKKIYGVRAAYSAIPFVNALARFVRTKR